MSATPSGRFAGRSRRPSRREPEPGRDAAIQTLRDLFAEPTLVVARALIGCRLVRAEGDGPRVGRIVEVEAYIGEDDQASHARFGRTGRNAVMFGPPGVAYVYLVYGMYDCLNVVTEPEGRAAAILLRAVEPIAGDAAMRAARARHEAGRRKRADTVGDQLARVAAVPTARLASGPGLLAAAFDIRREDTGSDLLDPGGGLRLEPRAAGALEPTVAATPRIGIAYAPEPWRSRPWRFVDADSPSVSVRPVPRGVRRRVR